ncbi:hypothetical protein PTKIN_Ptkin07bG0069400 [Pterospermum kingtungense]
MEVDPGCVLCGRNGESRDHLFFACDYAWGIWTKVLAMCGIHRTNRDWLQELQWICEQAKGKAVKAVILRIAWKAAIYHIWQERNNRLHGGAARSKDQVFGSIKEGVLARLSGMKKAGINRLLQEL